VLFSIGPERRALSFDWQDCLSVREAEYIRGGDEKWSQKDCPPNLKCAYSVSGLQSGKIGAYNSKRSSQTMVQA
jgi:hypothetical protein